MIRARYWYQAELRRRRRRRRLAILIAALPTLNAWAAARQGHSPASHPRPAGSGAQILNPGPGLTWVPYYGIALPVSRQNGPAHMEKGLAWGFTDTPAGALLAAVNIAVRATSQWGPPVYVPTIQRQVTGPDAPPGGDWAASATTLTSTVGYIPFPRSR